MLRKNNGLTAELGKSAQEIRKDAESAGKSAQEIRKAIESGNSSRIPLSGDLTRIRGDLRTPNGSTIIAIDVTPSEAFSALQRWENN